MRHHPAALAASRRNGPPCSGCGHVPATAAQREAVALAWLVAGPDGPAPRRFCRDCIPPGPVGDVACAWCGDGPLLAGDLAAGDARAAAAVQGWLAGAGWRLAGSVCPACAAGELTR